ncbi:hypothetical protein LUZ60_014858 [Juncus effusus]|nr:hypothetical protein LUZ60_014858 [Juncus effusus]
MGEMSVVSDETAGCHLLSRSSSCPSWLQTALSDIEQRVRSLEVSLPDEDETHSFAERAEHYYEKRPQLLSLLSDLHTQYLYLADRYSQSFKSHQYHHKKTLSLHSDNDSITTDLSEVESSLSFQAVYSSSERKGVLDLDVLLAEFVIVNVERDLLTAESECVERKEREFVRKIELQGSLLEVLESERMVLFGENARLGFRAKAAGEEAAAMANELGYMRHKAAELARLVVKLREEHRVCLFGRKMELLQAQIYDLEKRNRECFESMEDWEMERKKDRAEMERLRMENRRLAEVASRGKWWGSFRRFEWAPCMPEVPKGKVKGKGKGNGGCFCLYV